MKAIGVIYRKLTTNEFKAITNTINSDGGGSQTYIDFPKGSISDNNFQEFFDNSGIEVSKGYEWKFDVHSLSLGFGTQPATIKARRESSNSLREQNNENRIAIWRNDTSGFPDEGYDERNNPIIIYILKTDDSQYWAGWFYRNEFNDHWFLTKSLASIIFNDCGYIFFDEPILLDSNNYKWPFMRLYKGSKYSAMMKHQIIFYGAPGTGKSYTIDGKTDDSNSVRTTFHPDSDYASFVGAYKPTMENVPINSIYGDSVQFATGKNGHPGTEKKIVYKYVPQAFLKAYVAAWSDLDNPHYLIIEEINRGNCAQIFGDLFQLLDRNNQGASSYAIHADEDIAQFLAEDDKGFAKLSGEQKEAISSFVLLKDNGKTEAIGAAILTGVKLLLPPNLYIWATMNTSDQSLFPIDSAFKRRWNWRYVPIQFFDDSTDLSLKYRSFEVTGTRYSWASFLRIMNPIITELTESADKQMGFFFAKPDKKSSSDLRDNDVISEDIFVNKVLFYLWTDVLKDYNIGREEFKNPYKPGKALEFADFFEGGKNYLSQFIIKLGVAKIGDKLDNAENVVQPADEEGSGTQD